MIVIRRKAKKDNLYRINGVSPVRIEITGQELIEKEVKASGKTGRVYFPPHWIGRKVKIVGVD
jgi:hypothetical protein